MSSAAMVSAMVIWCHSGSKVLLTWLVSSFFPTIFGDDDPQWLYMANFFWGFFPHQTGLSRGQKPKLEKYWLDTIEKSLNAGRSKQKALKTNMFLAFSIQSADCTRRGQPSKVGSSSSWRQTSSKQVKQHKATIFGLPKNCRVVVGQTSSQPTAHSTYTVFRKTCLTWTLRQGLNIGHIIFWISFYIIVCNDGPFIVQNAPH